MGVGKERLEEVAFVLGKSQLDIFQLQKQIRLLSKTTLHHNILNCLFTLNAYILYFPRFQEETILQMKYVVCQFKDRRKDKTFVKIYIYITFPILKLSHVLYEFCKIVLNNVEILKLMDINISIKSAPSSPSPPSPSFQIFLPLLRQALLVSSQYRFLMRSTCQKQKDLLSLSDWVI